ncbi:MAG: DUF3347 domain-containing protein [Prolixibacteraceae bacterium]|nr:DUF3347 domain-containing protein [Prolixibacteraceae bacterium]
MKIDKTSFSKVQNDKWNDIASDAQEMAEHIGENADKLEHQRERFEMLSHDIYDLIKIFGSSEVICIECRNKQY